MPAELSQRAGSSRRIGHGSAGTAADLSYWVPLQTHQDFRQCAAAGNAHLLGFKGNILHENCIPRFLKWTDRQTDRLWSILGLACARTMSLCGGPAFLDCANSVSFGHAALMMSAVNPACERQRSGERGGLVGGGERGRCGATGGKSCARVDGEERWLQVTSRGGRVRRADACTVCNVAERPSLADRRCSRIRPPGGRQTGPRLFVAFSKGLMIIKTMRVKGKRRAAGAHR